jgi:prephenate dehydrogenase
MKRVFNKIGIVGTGLIGGSLGLAIKKKGLAKEVVGVSRHQESIALAEKLKAIDRGARSFKILSGADFIIFCLPVEMILRSAAAVRRVTGHGCLATDVASTKQEVSACLQRLFPYYVGSHPLAGSEKRGIACADSDLFTGSLCVVTPDRQTKKGALLKVSAFWRRLGARISTVSAPKHDKILGLTSHLPHALAFSLINSIPEEFFAFSAGALKGMTRIAASSPKLWSGIFLSNRGNILKALASFQGNLRALSAALRRGDRKAVVKILQRAQQKRQKLT